jgi:hypothetical protein
MIILKSLILTIILSALLALGLRNILGFWEGFCLAFALQTIISFVFSSLKITKEQDIADEYQAEIDELINMCTTTVECPCGKRQREGVVFVGIDNTFDCEDCGNTFKADISVTPTLLTEPTDVATTFDDLLQKQKEL